MEKPLVKKYNGVTAQGLVESALDKVAMLEKYDFHDMVVSIKSSDVLMCAEAYRLVADKINYPLHVGITEAGTVFSGNIKSAVGLGIILNQGIGDTIRVSLTGDPVNEIASAKLILKTLGLRSGGIEVVSCPTCGRTNIDLIPLANQVETMAADFENLNLKVAVMGCVVNGPGEAKEADVGIAGGNGEGLLIKKGEVIRKVPEDQLLDTLRYELEHWVNKMEVTTKPFFSVFPDLKVSDDVRSLFEDANIREITLKKKENTLKISFQCDHLISRVDTWRMERTIREQLFSKRFVKIRFQESYHLSEQYNLKYLMEHYMKSFLFELKGKGEVIFNVVRKGDYRIEDDVITFYFEDTFVNRNKAPEIKEFFEMILKERFSIDAKVGFDFSKTIDRSLKMESDYRLQQEIHTIVEHADIVEKEQKEEKKQERKQLQRKKSICLRKNQNIQMIQPYYMDEIVMAS